MISGCTRLQVCLRCGELGRRSTREPAEIIDERLKDLEANPNAGNSWGVVQERLQKKFDNRH
jgi:hypothetical protein